MAVERLLAVLSRLLADQNPMTVVVTCQMQQNRQNHRLTFAVCRPDLDWRGQRQGQIGGQREAVHLAAASIVIKLCDKIDCPEMRIIRTCGYLLVLLWQYCACGYLTGCTSYADCGYLPVVVWRVLTVMSLRRVEAVLMAGQLGPLVYPNSP